MCPAQYNTNTLYTKCTLIKIQSWDAQVKHHKSNAILFQQYGALKLKAYLPSSVETLGHNPVKGLGNSDVYTSRAKLDKSMKYGLVYKNGVMKRSMGL